MNCSLRFSAAAAFVLAWLAAMGPRGAAQERTAPAGNEPQLLPLTGDRGGVHDPVIARHGDTYYLYCTGGSRRRGGIIPVRASPDMRAWTETGFALESLPPWAAEEVPLARNAWAPDISFFNGKYHLYYSLSSFGVNHSAIGLATNTTLDPASPDYKWNDEGLAIRSRPDADDFNAIDPNLVIEDQSNVWLTWGSFWGGIMMRRIDPQTGKPSAEDTTLYKLASRPRTGEHQTPPVEGAIEAPFIVRRDGKWYMFVSWDFCCRGPRSDYKVIIGRADKVTGPYLDKDGRPLSEGGGSIILEAATDQWRGAGHPAVYQEDGVDYLLFHAYPAENGPSQLHISTIVWRDGWPVVAKLP
jgi:arabinan endo-1,5-alpha-L-arabinosidase